MQLLNPSAILFASFSDDSAFVITPHGARMDLTGSATAISELAARLANGKQMTALPDVTVSVHSAPVALPAAPETAPVAPETARSASETAPVA